MSETAQAKRETMSYEFITRNGNKITSITTITSGQKFEITEGETFNIRISKLGSDTTRWGGLSYWNITSQQNISNIWRNEAEIFAPWSFWNDKNKVLISNGLNLPTQDSIDWNKASAIDGGTPIQYKEDWDANLSYIPSVEYQIKTNDDTEYTGNKEVNIRLSLEKSSISSTASHSLNTGNNVITVTTELKSTDFSILIKDNDPIENKVFLSSYQGREGDWITLRFKRVGDLTRYAGLSVQTPSFTSPTSAQDSANSLYPYENYSSGWHGDWSLDQGNSKTGNRILVFAPGESEVAFQILLRSDGYAESTERLAFSVSDLGDLFGNRIYNGNSLEKLTFAGDCYVDILDVPPINLTPPSPTYSITSSATTINEGDGFTTTLTTTGVAAGTTYYWVRSGSGITSTDFIYGGLSGSASIGSDGKFSYTHLTENDLITEGDETVGFRVFSDSNRSQQVGSTVSILIRDTSITPAVSGVTVNGNNSGIANSGTITNNGTINTGTQTTNSNNTTTNTTNNTNNNINNFFTYYTNTTNNTNSNNTVTNTNSNNTLTTWNIYRVDNSVKAGDIVNQWFGTATPTSTQLQDISETKLMDVVASTWADKVQINRVVKASDAGEKLEAKQIDIGSGEVAGSVVSGGKGSDDIKGFAGWDNLEGGDGNDLIHGGNGRDIISGGAGRDELHGDFGWNTFKSEKDGVSDLIAVKSDHYLVNWLYGKAGNSPNGEKADIIEGLDSIDKIKIIGIDTREITFAANVSAKGVTGIGIYGKGILEALYTGGDLTVAQITQMTSGDASAAAMSNSINAYGVW